MTFQIERVLNSGLEIVLSSGRTLHIRWYDLIDTIHWEPGEPVSLSEHSSNANIWVFNHKRQRVVEALAED